MRTVISNKPNFFLVSVTCALILVLTLFFGNSALGKAKDKADAKMSMTENTIDERAIHDLIKGIQSDNTGLKTSAIYLAGYYKLEETVDALITEMNKEQDEDIKILAALALSRIGNDQAVNAATQLSNMLTMRAGK